MSSLILLSAASILRTHLPHSPRSALGFLPALLLLPIHLHIPVLSLSLCFSPSSHLLPALLCSLNHTVMISTSGNSFFAGPESGASPAPLHISLPLPMHHPLEKEDTESGYRLDILKDLAQ